MTPELVDDEVATACGLSSHSSFVNLQLFKTAQYDVMPPARRRTAREADAWPSAQQCGDCDFTFEPRQRQTDACMQARAERGRAFACAQDVETLRLREHGGGAVRGTDENDHRLAFADAYAAEHVVLEGRRTAAV